MYIIDKYTQITLYIPLIDNTQKTVYNIDAKGREATGKEVAE